MHPRISFNPMSIRKRAGKSFDSHDPPTPLPTLKSAQVLKFSRTPEPRKIKTHAARVLHTETDARETSIRAQITRTEREKEERKEMETGRCDVSPNRMEEMVRRLLSPTLESSMNQGAGREAVAPRLSFVLGVAGRRKQKGRMCCQANHGAGVRVRKSCSTRRHRTTLTGRKTRCRFIAVTYTGQNDLHERGRRRTRFSGSGNGFHGVASTG